MWILKECDGTEQRVMRWEELDWSCAQDDAQATFHDDLHSKMISEMLVENEIGHGTYGVAFVCTFPSLSHEKLVVKLPRDMLENFRLLEITSDGHLREMDLSGSEDDSEIRAFKKLSIQRTKCKSHAQTVFAEEFANYQKVYSVPMRESMTKSEHAQLSSHDRHAHIHRFLYFDAHVPALFSERCCGTLAHYRRNPKSRDLFNATLVNRGSEMAPEWQNVATQVVRTVHQTQS